MFTQSEYVRECRQEKINSHYDVDGFKNQIAEFISKCVNYPKLGSNIIPKATSFSSSDDMFRFIISKHKQYY